MKVWIVVLFTVSALVPLARAGTTPKNVLILSGGRGRVSINQMEAALRAHFSEPVNFSIVDLDNPRFEQKSYQDNLAEALRAGYSNEKLDLVVAVMTVALRFAVQYHDKLFPGVPIVFMSNISPILDKMWPGVTGVESTSGVRETIDLALRLHPDTEAVAVITDVKYTDGDWLKEEQAELVHHRDKVREIDLVGPPTPELLQRVATLPPHTVLLFQLYPQDSNQPAFGAMDVLAAVTERFPTYSILPHITVGHGGIGGASYDPSIDPVLAGELAARVLSGEPVDHIPVVQNSKAVVSVDWRQLRRWNIPESALPPGTTILFREPTLWEQGRKYFIAGIAVIVVQLVLIFALFWERARRRKAEEAISGFSRRLIEAQETERTRIARELHDDINQRLAMVAISLKTAKEGLPSSEGKTSRILEEAGECVSELESDVQALSHQLHSSKLEYLGLEAAASGFCRELSERQNVTVNLRCESIPEDLSSDIGLCLFRVLQESLHNALKYSGVNEFEVSLNGVSKAIELRVHDSGAGFDAKRIGNGHGLGLTSMKERLRLVGGECSIDSVPGQGTTVIALVPVADPKTIGGIVADFA